MNLGKIKLEHHSKSRVLYWVWMTRFSPAHWIPYYHQGTLPTFYFPVYDTHP
jgi:hypothetical protein